MPEDFYIQARVERNKYLFKTEELFFYNRGDWFKDFGKHFEEVCTRIEKMQSDSDLLAVSYLEYTMLYTNFINRKYVSEIRVYGTESYLDKKQRYIGEYDISFLFVYYDRLWDELIELQKRFPKEISRQKVTEFMLESLADFYSYFTNIIRFGAAECFETQPFTDIKKNDIFTVSAGGYMEKTEPVYFESRNKDAQILAEWFEEGRETEYMFGDYSDLDFSHRDFRDTNFAYSRFRNSRLNLCRFENSLLAGVNFGYAEMEGVCFDGCRIHEADFTGAVLKNASFIGAEGAAGQSDRGEWKSPGFLPVVFRGADLSGANFTGANLVGADFTGAVMDGARISAVERGKRGLSEEQMKAVIFI